MENMKNRELYNYIVSNHNKLDILEELLCKN